MGGAWTGLQQRGSSPGDGHPEVGEGKGAPRGEADPKGPGMFRAVAQQPAGVSVSETSKAQPGVSLPPIRLHLRNPEPSSLYVESVSAQGKRVSQVTSVESNIRAQQERHSHSGHSARKQRSQHSQESRKLIWGMRLMHSVCTTTNSTEHGK